MKHSLYCYYDFRVSPYSYDFITFLGIAETTRIRRGLKDIKVYLINGQRKNDLGRQESNDIFFSNVIIPSLTLLNSLTGFYFVNSEELKNHDFNTLYTFPRGYSVQRPTIGYLGHELVISQIRNDKKGILNSPAYARKFIDDLTNSLKTPEFITLTCREIERDDVAKKRSLQINVWGKALKKISDIGITPIIIRDTGQAKSKNTLFPNFLESPEASIHLPYRLALYEKALHNFSKNSGPAILFNFSRCSSGTFMEFDNSTASCSEPFLRKNYGMNFLSNYPFSYTCNSLLWGPENYQKILESFNGALKTIPQKLNQFNSLENLKYSYDVAIKGLLHNLKWSDLILEDLVLIEKLIILKSKHKGISELTFFQYTNQQEGQYLETGFTKKLQQIFNQYLESKNQKSVDTNS